MKKWKCRIIGGIFCLLLSGCTSIIVGTMIEPTVDNLQKQKDLQLVCDGAPAYLLMIDSMLAETHDNEKLLLIATQSYSSYATVLAVCDRPDRAAQLSEKAKDYGLALLADCLHIPAESDFTSEALERALASCSRRDVPSLFWGGYGWALWLKNQAGSPSSLAALPKVEAIMKRVLLLDEGYNYGAAHLFLGSYYASIPAMLGGKPEEGKRHFTRALELADRQFLPAQVAFAETYARTIFDRELFAQLLREVVAFPLEKSPDCILANQVAKKKAERLLADMDNYF